MTLDWGCPQDPADDINLIGSAEMDSHRQSISLIEEKIGFKRQPAYTDFLGLTVKFLTDKMAFGSIDDGTSQADLRAHALRLPALHGDPSPEQRRHDIARGCLENLGIPEIGNGPLIPIFDPNFLSFFKEVLRGGSGKFQADFVGRALSHHGRNLSLGFHLDGYGQSYLWISTGTAGGWFTLFLFQWLRMLIRHTLIS